MPVVLVNPDTGKPLHEVPGGLGDEDGHFVPDTGGAYRFVSVEDYTASFGYQWNRFARTQIDKFNPPSTLSQDRLFAVTGWHRLDLSGEDILEVGCGAGRFTQIMLDHTAANLYSLDRSNAVDANFANNGPHPRLRLFQADVYRLPFADDSFDRVFCFGVLQFTPDPERAVRALIDKTRPGGEVVVDFFPMKGWWTRIQAKYLLRPLTTRMPRELLMSLVESNVDWMIRASQLFTRLGIGQYTNRLIPLCSIENFPSCLRPGQIREWAILDTFNMFSHPYERPLRISEVEAWFSRANMRNTFAGPIFYGDGHEVNVVKGVKSS